ncbi:MAG: hypothetical protein KatS3mg105_4611 [Gemmatales bacterium]|nr:MAG: hypothetical protein KatS3mg105_4611 [Gemmatales bacterium]
MKDVSRSPVVDRIAEALRESGADEGVIVCAVSGGADSTALLLSLQQIAPLRVVAAHFNHQLRGSASDGDETFVRLLCQQLSLPIEVHRADVGRLAASQKKNLEQTAREWRYDWLCQVASRHHARWIATAHTADDQAETVVHRLLRGTGLRGLRGIARKRPISPDVFLIRPMLFLRRHQVLQFLAERGQDFRTDESNFDRRRTRNRIRHELLPMLAEEYNPDIVGVLTRLAEQAAVVFEGLEAEARELLVRSELPRAGPLVILKREPLQRARENLCREALRYLWYREGWPRGQMSFDAWNRLMELIRANGTALDLPGGVRARSRRHVVQIGREPSPGKESS